MWDSIIPENLFLVVVDFQEKFFPLMEKKHVKLAQANICNTVQMFTELNVPMIGTDHYRKGLGFTDQKVLDLWAGKSFKDKSTFSCCGQNEFLEDLEAINRPIAVIVGLEAHICVLQTTIDLIGKGYQVVILKDACLSSSELKWSNGLELMKEEGAKIMNTETLLFYLLKKIGTPEFKCLTQLLKRTAESLKN